MLPPMVHGRAIWLDGSQGVVLQAEVRDGFRRWRCCARRAGRPPSGQRYDADDAIELGQRQQHALAVRQRAARRPVPAPRGHGPRSSRSKQVRAMRATCPASPAAPPPSAPGGQRQAVSTVKVQPGLAPGCSDPHDRVLALDVDGARAFERNALAEHLRRWARGAHREGRTQVALAPQRRHGFDHLTGGTNRSSPSLPRPCAPFALTARSRTDLPSSPSRSTSILFHLTATREVGIVVEPPRGPAGCRPRLRQKVSVGRRCGPDMGNASRRTRYPPRLRRLPRRPR